MKTISTADFEQAVLKSKIPVLIDFYADWCGPCKALTPILESIALKKDGRLNIFKVDIDASESLSQKFRINSIPTLLLFKEGVIIGQRVGGAAESQIAAWIEESLTKSEPLTIASDTNLKRTPLTEEQKRILVQEMLQTLAEHPKAADKPRNTNGPDGTPMTWRKQVMQGIEDGTLYTEAEEEIAQEQSTFEKFIEDIRKTRELNHQPKPQPHP